MQPPTETATPGLLRRLAAIFYDSLLIGALWMMLGGLLVFINHNQIIELPILPLLLPLLTFAFYTKFWRSNGQTLGMQTWKIKLVSADGGAVSWQQCWRRFAGATVSWLCFGLGYWWMLFNREKLTWHDRWSNTRLIIVSLPHPD